MVRVQPYGDRTTAILQVSDVDSSATVEARSLSFVLTLERDAGLTYARGQLRSLLDDVTYPIQSSAALLERLSLYLAPRSDG